MPLPRAALPASCSHAPASCSHACPSLLCPTCYVVALPAEPCHPSPPQQPEAEHKLEEGVGTDTIDLTMSDSGEHMPSADTIDLTMSDS